MSRANQIEPRYNSIVKPVYKLILFLTFLVTSLVIIRYYSIKNTPPYIAPVPTLTPSPTSTPVIQSSSNLFHVKRVIDGDTFVLDNDQKVRLIGINAPESDACYASEATDVAIQLLEGKEVSLEKDISDTDKYDRLLRYVHIGDTFVNEYLVREGYAQAVTYPPDVKYKDIFIKAQKDAKTNNAGLWGSCLQN